MHSNAQDVAVACLALVCLPYLAGQQQSGCTRQADGSCEACPVGKYDHDLDTWTGCFPCPEGTYSPGNATICEECAAGKIDYDRNANTPCYGCEVGRYTPNGYRDTATVSDTVRCPKCELGMADLDINPGTPCEACEKGQYSPEAQVGRVATQAHTQTPTHPSHPTPYTHL
jgi:hypothetical protein